MALDFSIGNLTNDQSSGVQVPSDGNDIDVTLNSGQLDGLDSGFEAFLAGLGLSAGQKAFAVDVDAGYGSSLIQVSATEGETINDLKLIANSTIATNWTNLAGDPLYLHVDATGNYATLTTATGSGGTIVAAFALTGEVIDNTAHTASAGVQMVTFEPISHPDTDNPDDTLALGDVLKVGVDTAASFDFHQLDAGNFLWAAVGTSASAMLITGQDLNVIDTPGKLGDKVNSGANDPCDTVNTSKATDTTIGINAQHFAPTNTGDGAPAVFTFVSGLATLGLSTPQYTGQNITQIDYDHYINVSSASVFISQLTGGSSAKISFSLVEAGGGGTADHLTSALIPEEGYNSDSTNKYSYIGNQDSDSNLKDDTPVMVATVTVRGFTWDSSTSGTLHNGVTVTITGNNVIVLGAQANDLITLTAADDAGTALDGTFNRIDVQALFGSAAFDIGYVALTSGGTTSEGLGSHLYVDDDGPTLAASSDADKPNDLQVANKTDTTGHDESFYTLAPGTDGLLSYTFVGSEDTDGAFQWTYDDTSHTSITGTYNTATTQTELYTLLLNADGSYDFDMTGLIPGSSLDLNQKEVIKAGAPDAPVLQVGLVQNDEYVELLGGGGNINESHGFVGVGNGNLDVGESMTLTLHEADGDLLTFQAIQIGTKSAQGGEYKISYHIAGTPAGQMVDAANESVLKNGTIDVSSSDLGGATVDSITVMKVSGPATKIGIGDIHIIVQPDDAQLQFTVELKDGDNDATTSSFLVAIDGNNDGSYDASVNSLAIVQPLSVDQHMAMLFDQPMTFMHQDSYMA